MRQVFFKNLIRNDKNTKVLLSSNAIYYLSLHIKLSSVFYSTQLCDLFVYELPQNVISTSTLLTTPCASNVAVYNFHSICLQQRFFIFVTDARSEESGVIQTAGELRARVTLSSITELFLNAGWLEREAAELSATVFINKKDLRNLMLQYGDVSAPFQKSFPSVGVKEIFYDSVNDLLLQSPITLQF